MTTADVSDQAQEAMGDIEAPEAVAPILDEKPLPALAVPNGSGSTPAANTLPDQLRTGQGTGRPLGKRLALLEWYKRLQMTYSAGTATGVPRTHSLSVIRATRRRRLETPPIDPGDRMVTSGDDRPQSADKCRGGTHADSRSGGAHSSGDGHSDGDGSGDGRSGGDGSGGGGSGDGGTLFLPPPMPGPPARCR